MMAREPHRPLRGRRRRLPTLPPHPGVAANTAASVVVVVLALALAGCVDTSTARACDTLREADNRIVSAATREDALEAIRLFRQGADQLPDEHHEVATAVNDIADALAAIRQIGDDYPNARTVHDIPDSLDRTALRAAHEFVQRTALQLDAFLRTHC